MNSLIKFGINSTRIRIMFSLFILFLFIASGFESDYFNLEFIGYVKPKISKEIKNSPWGIQASTLDEDILSKMSEIGVKWTRLQINWPDVEKTSGVYSWEEIDNAFTSTLNLGITPFVTICGTNEIYVKEKRKLEPQITEIYGTKHLPPTSNTKAFNAWLRFTGEVITRYKDKIKYWEIWNEPNHFAYWGDEPNGKEYGKLVHETANVIRSIDPEAKIIAGATASLDPEFTDEFLQVDNANLIDIISFHNYGVIPEERIYKALEVWEVINKHNPSIQLWQGECGYPSHSSTRDYRGLSPWGLQIQAKWLLRQSFTDTYFCRVTISNYFKLYHEGGRGKVPTRSFLTKIDSTLGFPERNGSRVKVIGVNEKCLLENPSLKPKPGYFAYQNLCAIMDSEYKPVENKKEIKVIDEGIFYGIGKEDDAFPSIPLLASFKNEEERSLIAYWLPWHPQEIIKFATIDLKVYGIEYKDPVLIDLLKGEVLKIKQFSQEKEAVLFHNIPLADYPFVIMEKSSVQLSDTKVIN